MEIEQQQMGVNKQTLIIVIYNQQRVVQLINIIVSKMQPVDIEKLANQACFATQYEIKSKAQQQFYALCQNLSQLQLEQLMNNYSETVLFVTMEYIYKIIPTLKDQRSLLIPINTSAEAWYNTNTNATLIRTDRRPLQQYVENSVGRTLGQCLKYIYLQKQHSQFVIKFIKDRLNLRYRLYLWKLLIQTVSSVDNELTFLVYRSMVYNFQQNVIPEIMDSLLPYFQSVKQQIEINDLAFMQSHLSVSDKNGIENGTQISMFNPGQVKFTDLVFQVLKQIICFNYNITYSEYQSQTPIDNCLVCFPDPVTKKVANKQFISSIFFVAEKLINDTILEQVPTSNQNATFLTITLECIQKIMLTKLFYTSSEVKNQFIKTVLVCMARLMGSPKLNQVCILSLVQSNLKFLINIELHQIKNHREEYKLWITTIKNIIMGVLTKSVIYMDNQLVTECIQLASKIVEESSAPQLKEEIKIFKDFGSEVACLVIDRIFSQNHCIIGNSKVRDFEGLQKNLSMFLKRPRHLICLNRELVFSKMEPIMVKLAKQPDVNSIANLYFLFSQLCDVCVIQRNIIYQSAQNYQKTHLGKLLCFCLQWIATYRGYNQPMEMIQISILIFIKRLLSEALSSFNYEDNQIKLTSEIYKCIQQNQVSLNPQQFLSFCYSQIASNIMNSDYSRANYTFQVLTNLLLKFKWGIKREHFRQTSIAKNVLQMCKQLSESNFAGEMLTLRKQLFKIITNISFDDILDDYRNNINELILNLQKCLTQNRWKAMYDLTGICQAIDTSVIYRYFMITLQKSKITIPTIMNELFHHVDQASGNSVSQKIELVKSILRLQHSMIQNKGQRLAGPKNTFYNYRLIGYLMPYWGELLNQKQLQDEDWDQAIIQLYRIFNTLLKNNNTNFFILERSVPSYHQFIQNLLLNMVSISGWVELYPILFTQYRSAMQQISKELMEVIFCHKNPDVVSLFNKLLNIFLKINMKGIQLLNQGNKAMEDNLDIYFEIIKNVFKYLRNAKKLQHKTLQIKNINVLNENIQVKLEYILVLFKFGISCGKKSPRTLDQICKIIHNMDFLARSTMAMISQKLGLAENIRQSLLKIWNENEENKGQFSQEIEDTQFLIDIKEWFKKCDSGTLMEPDY